MFSTHDGRGRQIARTLIGGVASAALAGSAAAWASGGNGGTASAPAAKRVAHAADCAKPDAGGDARERSPLKPDDPIVLDARTRLQALVTAGQAEQGEVDAVLREVIAGSVNLDELVRAGTLTAAHAATIDGVLRALKDSHRADKPEPAEGGKK
jgi:hypothetical protein